MRYLTITDTTSSCQEDYCSSQTVIPFWCWCDEDSLYEAVGQIEECEVFENWGESTLQEQCKFQIFCLKKNVFFFYQNFLQKQILDIQKKKDLKSYRFSDSVGKFGSLSCFQQRYNDMLT